jgi:hypothetical protein
MEGIALDAETTKGVLAFLGLGSETERIEEVGHFMLEKPAEINGRILQFLRKKQ